MNRAYFNDIGGYDDLHYGTCGGRYYRCICKRHVAPLTPGYNFANLREYNLRNDTMNVTGVTCSDGYIGTPTISPCLVEGGAYNFLGCSPACTRPPLPVLGYDFTSINEIDLRLSSFNVTGLKCARGYRGTPTASKCDFQTTVKWLNGVKSYGVKNIEYGISGCIQIPSCTSTAALIPGYDFTNRVEYDLTLSNFNVYGITCADGYVGSPKTTKCNAVNEPYNISGCTKIPICDRLLGKFSYIRTSSDNYCELNLANYEYIDTKDACEAAAEALNLGDKTAQYYRSGSRPPGCFYRYNRLYFNPNKPHQINSNYRCSFSNRCICRKQNMPSVPGYNFANLREYNLRNDTMNVTGVTCSDGYIGTPTISPCLVEGGAYNFLGCSPACTRPPLPVLGYDFTSINEIDLRLSSFNVTGLKCARGYRGTPTASKCARKNTNYRVLGCTAIPNTCTSASLLSRDAQKNNVLRYTPKYNFSAVVETSLSRDNLDVTGIKCAAGYVGEVSVSVCTSKGQPYIISGCFKLCKRPTNVKGYNFDDVNESSLRITTFDVTGITCAAGYSGSVSVSKCQDDGDAKYVISGCQLDPNKVCVRPTSSSLQRYGYNVIEYDKTKQNFNVIVDGCLGGYETRNGISPTVTLCDNAPNTFSAYGLHGCYMKKVQRYKLLTSGQCALDEIIDDESDCNRGIRYLGLYEEYGPVFRKFDVHNGVPTCSTDCPPGCYTMNSYKKSYLNYYALAAKQCSSDSKCICKDLREMPGIPNVYRTAIAPRSTAPVTKAAIEATTMVQLPTTTTATVTKTGIETTTMVQLPTTTAASSTAPVTKAAIETTTMVQLPTTTAASSTAPVTKAAIETTTMVQLPTTHAARYVTPAPVTKAINQPETTTSAKIESIVVEQKLQLSGATKKDLEANKKQVENAIAKTLDVTPSKVKIIAIIEVQQQHKRRNLLGESINATEQTHAYIEVVYEVEIEDEEAAKDIVVGMKKETFKSTLNSNIQTESSSLNVAVENVEKPTIKKMYTQRAENPNAINPLNQKEETNTITHDKGKGGSSLSPVVTVIIILIVAVMFCSGLILYICKRRSTDAAKEVIEMKNRNTWDLKSIDISMNRDNKMTHKEANNYNVGDKSEKEIQVHSNPLRESALGFVFEERLQTRKIPTLNKKLKPNRRSAMTIDNDDQWIEYIDESSHKPYYYNPTSETVQWEKPENLLFYKEGMDT